MDQGRCREAKRVVRLGASNSAGLQLRSARGPAFAPTDEFINNAACRLGTSNGRFHLRHGIANDAVGALDVGWQLEQQRDLQGGTRANPNRAVSFSAASDLYRAFGHGAWRGIELRPVALLAGSAVNGGCLLDQAQAGGKTSASAFSAGVSDLQETSEGARGICHLKMRKRVKKTKN